jgi:hypothetical protein
MTSDQPLETVLRLLAFDYAHHRPREKLLCTVSCRPYISTTGQYLCRHPFSIRLTKFNRSSCRSLLRFPLYSTFNLERPRRCFMRLISFGWLSCSALSAATRSHVITKWRPALGSSGGCLRTSQLRKYYPSVRCLSHLLRHDIIRIGWVSSQPHYWGPLSMRCCSWHTKSGHGRRNYPYAF